MGRRSKSNKITYLCICFLLFVPCILYAQPDGALAWRVSVNNNKVSRANKAQTVVIGSEAAGRNVHDAALKKIYGYQEEFHDYITTFNDILAYAAETYGFYSETQYLIKNINDLNKELKKNPSNAVALALSGRKNIIYTSVYKTGASIIANLNSACIGVDGKKNKLTEEERLNLLFDIRPKLRILNDKIETMRILIHHTNLQDLWYEITHRKPDKRSKKEVAEYCLGVWKNKGKLE